MKRWIVVVVMLSSLALVPGTGRAAGPKQAVWPSLERQLAQDRIIPGSALETLIRENQDFAMLRTGEARDKNPVPAWLRVWWRKGHPDMVYSASDPTGGYPHVLKEIHEWMLTHQDLQPGLPEIAMSPVADSDGIVGVSLGATVGANSRISGAQTSARSESDIRINFWNPSKIVAASNNISASGMQAQFYSADGGVTWGQTTLPLFSTDSFHSDPTADWTSDGTAWSTTIGIKGNTLKMRAYKSTNGGATWTFDNTFSGSQRSTDKEIMWIDHSNTSAFKDYIYVCWHNGTPLYVNRRTGPVGAWGSPVQVSGTESSGTAIGCDVKTNSAGDAFAFWPTTSNRRVVVAKSTNGGTSWGAGVVAATTFDGYDIGVPSFASRRALIYISGGAFRDATRNEVYASWTDLSGETGCTAAANEPGTNAASTCKTRIWFARSTNGGSTWSAPIMVNNQASKNDQFNQWLAVDEVTGQIGVMYYDTVNDANRKKTDVWFQSSVDGGVTWSAATKVTTAMTDETIAGADSGNQYGDYNGLTGYNGTFFPSWTDRRNNAKEEVWTVPVQDP
ncbi:MAG TPA: sialidase family protein [Thermoanaerobaculia bacterium]|nr:sialidase family protein [Thermoanaerobaculia bacterium]